MVRGSSVGLKALALVAVLAVCSLVAAQNPILPADKYMKLVREVPNAALYRIQAPSPVFADINLPVIHLWGTSDEMGYAHGYIYADEIMDFMTKSMPPVLAVAVDEVLSIGKSDLPNYVKELFDGSALELYPMMSNIFLNFLVRAQTPYMNDTDSRNTIIEMTAMARGICDNWQSRGKACDLPKVTMLVQGLNLFPDLVRMACSIFGTWGQANAPGNPNLIQMRALDFGAGPFPNASTLIVQHPSEPGRNSFASLSFPGFAAVVTGVSTKIALSEKVWLTSKSASSKPTAFQDGSYYGEADVMVMRRMLEYANTVDEAVDMAMSATRTWGVWLGIGQKTNSTKTGVPVQILQYRRADVRAFDDKTLPVETQGDYLPGVVFVDKHPQPSASSALGVILKQQYGQITAEWAVQNVPASTKSGDVHIAFFDFNTDQMYVSTGVTNAYWLYPDSGGGQAYSRPFLKFDLQKLWNTPRPKLM